MAFALTLAVVTVVSLLGFGFGFVIVRRRTRGRGHSGAYPQHTQDASFEARLRARTAGLAADNDALRRELAERTRAESDLRTNEERYRALVPSNAIVWRTTAAREFDTEQPEWTGFTGQAPDEFRGTRWTSAVHPDDRDAFSHAWAAAQAAGHAFETEHRLRHADGTYYSMAVRVAPLLGTDGTVREWVGTHALLAGAPRGPECAPSADRSALQLDRLPLAFLQCDATNRYTHWNHAAERMFGFSRAEVLGKRPFEVIVPERGRGTAESLFARLAIGDTDAHGVFENVTKSGRVLVCEWHTAPLFSAEGVFQGAVALAQDVTARHRHGDQLSQTQKMDAICHLAGGVAHDFNNLLTIITGYTRMLAASCPEGTPAGEALGEVRAASLRATDLTRQLLAFGRLQVLRPRVLNVNGLVTETQKVLAQLVGENVRLVCTLAPNLGLVSADPDQIEQALTTLCVYARDAMPHGGRLVLTTDAVTITDQDHADAVGLALGRYVRLAVADSGYGMTPDVQQQIFEPFFSTQGVGKGTGLGLAAVYGIVKQSSGHITVDSTLGAGTTFTIYLPAAPAAVPASGVKALPSSLARGGETILLVEDERPVRALASLTLRGAGYTVIEAASGEDAIELFNTRPGVQLLLTDMVMPGMSGRELADALRERDPGLPLIYMSGYTDDARMRREIAAADSEFLQKPFEVDDLLLTVRQALDGSDEPSHPLELAGSRS